MRKELVVRLCQISKFSESFNALYKGKPVYEGTEDNVYALACRISVFAEAEDQVYEIMCESGYSKVILNCSSEEQKTWKNLINKAFVQVEEIRNHNEDCIYVKEDK